MIICHDSCRLLQLKLVKSLHNHRKRVQSISALRYDFQVNLSRSVSDEQIVLPRMPLWTLGSAFRFQPVGHSSLDTSNYVEV